MLQLLSPLALLALAALAVPTILHLWRPPAKTVRIGTLKFFTGPAVRRLNKLRWRERLLLAVRLLLLTLLALLLAQPIWRKELPTKPQKWALFEKGIQLSSGEQKRWSELKASGFEAREFATGFARAGAGAKARNGGSVDVWSLLRELDAKLPAGSAVAIFGSGQMESLRGARPQMQHLEVDWVQSTVAPEQERTWIASLRLPNGTAGSPRELSVVIGRSKTGITEYVRASVPAVAGQAILPPELKALSLEIDERFSARLLRDNKPAQPEDWAEAAQPRVWSVVLLHDATRLDDARYVEAALRAVAEMAGDTLTFGRDLAGADWVFWLNDQPPSEEVLQAVRDRGASLLSDATHSETAVATRSWFGDHRIELLRRTAPTGDSGAAVWLDGFGVPVLTASNEGHGRHWRFFSRFHPDWNALPRSSALPAALRSILAANAVPARANHDLRRADATQLGPGKTTGAGEPSIRLARELEDLNLHHAIWWLCAGLFVLERVLSHRRSAAPETQPQPAERAEVLV